MPRKRVVDKDFPEVPGSSESDPEPDDEPQEKPAKKLRLVARAKGPNTKTLEECAEITDELQARIVQRLAPFAPVAGGYWAERAEANTRAVARIAAGRPDFAEKILRLAEMDAYFVLGDFAIGLVVAVAVEVGAHSERFGLNYHSMLSKAYGLEDIAEAVNRELEASNAETAEHYRSGMIADEQLSEGLMGELLSESPA